ncbi:hypothetical protein Tco_0187845, partial [Tanacetum coccineum]
MAALRYRDEHNKVGYMQKPKGSDDYHQILDFLGASHIRYVVPTGRVVVPTSRYVVPTGRVVVPTGRYVVPAGK